MTPEKVDCVLVTSHREHATAFAMALGHQGIAADVKGETPPGAEFTHLMPQGPYYEVWVRDPADAPRARELAAEIERRVTRRESRVGTVAAVCEECGKTADYPAAAQGTVEVCPHCGAFLDVPDPDDDTDLDSTK